MAHTAIRPRPIDNRQSTQNRESNSQLAFNLSAKVIILLHLRAFGFHVFAFRYAFSCFPTLFCSRLPSPFPLPRRLSRHFSPRNGRHRALLHFISLNRLNFNPLSAATPFLLYWSSPCAAKSRNTENQTRRLLYIIPLVQNKTRQLLHETPRLFAKTSGLSKTLPLLIIYFPLL